MKTNIAAAWIDRAKEKYESVAEGVRHMNLVCNQKMQTSSVYAMRSGQKNIPDCVYFHMLNDVLLTEMENAGFSIRKGDFEQLRDRLAPPQRCK